MFFVLDRPALNKGKIVYGTEGGDGYPQPIWETTNCHKCRRPITMKQINNLRMELFGEELRHIVWTDNGPLFTTPLVQKLTTSNLHGFTFRPVDIVAWWKVKPMTNTIGNAIEWEDAPVLYQLIPVGYGGSVLHHNRVKVSITCSKCKGEEYTLLDRGITIDKLQWDGNDLFTLKEYPALLIITQRFERWLRQNEIENYHAIRALDFSFRDLRL